MKISVIGSGYVGLVSGACLSDLGHDVLCLDLDVGKINLLKSGNVPIYEPGLQEILKKNINAGRLKFTNNIEESVDHGFIQMIAVGTPSDENGSADMQHVLKAAKSIGQNMTESKIIVDKSTVPVGTAEMVKSVVNQELSKRTCPCSIRVVSNPEFLKEGSAIEDFFNPDRIVIGAEDEKSVSVMNQLYASFNNNNIPLIFMDLKSAELTKYAANAMLATRISFMNELANLAELCGANIDHIYEGIGSDKRIGYDFLLAGAGYGGSCLPKDIRALKKTSEDLNYPLKILTAVEEVNEAQKKVLLSKVLNYFDGDLSEKSLAIWGLAFKSGTDDIREAVSHVLIKGLCKNGSSLRVYDPLAMEECKKIYENQEDLRFSNTAFDAIKNVDALIILTDWEGFKEFDFQKNKSQFQNPVIFDGRNLFKTSDKRIEGFEYFSIGRDC
jgi:UDPglucose 6-dehydrogenase